MRRLNVQFSQIEECIRLSMFAVDMLPANPPLSKGEPLLLQLTAADAKAHDILDKRVQFALIFDHVTPDPTGDISRGHWPNAGKVWKYILYCSETIPCIPFSLERLNLSRNYGGQTNPFYIQLEDQARIRPYLKGGAEPDEHFRLASVEDLLAAIRNHDRIVHQEPRTHTVREHERRLGDPWLGNALKQYYEYRCQICLHDFKPKYSTPYADTRFLDSSGEPISRNVVVVCPNHNAIISATQATFERHSMAFSYPNGLVEKLTLRDHLLN